MAKKIELDDDDDLLDGFDDFEDDDLDFGDEPVKKDRNPIVELSSGVVSAFNPKLHGIGFLTDVTKNILPSSYGNALDTIIDLKDTATNIFDAGKKELRPALNVMDRAVKQALPTVGAFLPKRITKALKDMAFDDNDSDESNYTSSNDNPDNTTITSTLTNIFGATRLENNLQTKRDDIVRVNKENVDEAQFEATLSEQSNMSYNLSRMVSYQDTVLDKYYRRSLELQHLHYYATRDILALSKSTGMVHKTLLESIVKNTALPNEVKVQNMEQFKDANKKKIIGIIQNDISERLGDLPKRLKEGLERQVVDFARGISEGARQMQSGADMAAEMSEMTGQSSMFTMGNELIGSGLRDTAGKRLANMLKRRTYNTLDVINPNISANINRGGSWLSRMLSDGPGKITRMMRESDGQGVGGFLEEILGRESGIGETINRNLSEDASADARWDILSRRTLIEIIPGFQSKHLQMLTNIFNVLSGNPGEAEAMVYSTDTESFVTASKANSKVKEKFKRQLGYGTADNLSTMVSKIDTDNVMTPEERKELSLIIAKKAGTGENFDPKDYIDENNLPTNWSEETRQKVIDLFTEKFGISDHFTNGEFRTRSGSTAETSQNITEMANLFTQVRRDLGNFSKTYGKYNETGEKSKLADIGAIGEDGKVRGEFRWDLIRELLDDRETRIAQIAQSRVPENTFNFRQASNSRTSVRDVIQPSSEDSRIVFGQANVNIPRAENDILPDYISRGPIDQSRIRGLHNTSPINTDDTIYLTDAERIRYNIGEADQPTWLENTISSKYKAVNKKIRNKLGLADIVEQQRHDLNPEDDLLIPKAWLDAIISGASQVRGASTSMFSSIAGGVRPEESTSMVHTTEEPSVQDHIRSLITERLQSIIPREDTASEATTASITANILGNIRNNVNAILTRETTSVPATDALTPQDNIEPTVLANVNDTVVNKIEDFKKSVNNYLQSSIITELVNTRFKQAINNTISEASETPVANTEITTNLELPTEVIIPEKLNTFMAIKSAVTKQLATLVMPANNTLSNNALVAIPEEEITEQVTNYLQTTNLKDNIDAAMTAMVERNSDTISNIYRLTADTNRSLSTITDARDIPGNYNADGEVVEVSELPKPALDILLERSNIFNGELVTTINDRLGAFTSEATEILENSSVRDKFDDLFDFLREYSETSLGYLDRIAEATEKGGSGGGNSQPEHHGIISNTFGGIKSVFKTYGKARSFVRPKVVKVRNAVAKKVFSSVKPLASFGYNTAKKAVGLGFNIGKFGIKGIGDSLLKAPGRFTKLTGSTIPIALKAAKLGFGVSKALTGGGLGLAKFAGKALLNSRGSKLLKAGVGYIPKKILGMAGSYGKGLSEELFGQPIVNNNLNPLPKFGKKLKDVYVRGNLMEPALKARKLLNGEYFDKLTGKRITSFSDIKGEVVDRLGSVVLSIEDYGKGLVDNRGKPIIGVFTKAYNALSNKYPVSTKIVNKLIGTPLKRLADIIKPKEGEKISDVVGRIKSSVKNSKLGNNLPFEFAGKAIEQIMGTIEHREDKVAGILTKIYDYMQKAWPQEDTETKTGNRSGGVNDIIRRRAEAKKAKEAKTAAMGAASRSGGTLLGNEDDRKDEEEGGGIVDTLKTAGAGIAGWLGLGKAGGLMSKIPTLLRGGAAVAGASGAATTGAATVAGAGEVAAAGTGISGLIASAGGLGGMAATAGATLLAFATPIGYAALAAGIAYGGYKAFKYAQRRQNLKPLEMLRFLQYGIPVNNSHALVTIRYFEDEMSSHIDLKGGDKPVDLESVEIWEKFYKEFGGDYNNQNDYKNFVEWFYHRYLPVYIKHSAAAKAYGDIDLEDVENLSKENKTLFLNSIQFGSVETKLGMSPYLVASSPWPDIALADNTEAIKTLTEQIRNGISRGEDVSVDNLGNVKGTIPKLAAALPPKAESLSNKYENDKNKKAEEEAGLSFLDRTRKWREDNIYNPITNIAKGTADAVKGAYKGAVDWTSRHVIEPGSRVFDSVSKGFKEQAPKLLERLKSTFGLTDIQAAGIVGNLGHESAGLKAGIQEGGVTSGRGGLGWAQWTGPRRVTFENLARETGLSVTDPELNYLMLENELKGPYRKVVDKLKSVTGDVRDAVYVFERGFEASGDVDRRSGAIIKPQQYASRYKYANEALKLAGITTKDNTNGGATDSLVPSAVPSAKDPKKDNQANISATNVAKEEAGNVDTKASDITVPSFGSSPVSPAVANPMLANSVMSKPVPNPLTVTPPSENVANQQEKAMVTQAESIAQPTQVIASVDTGPIAKVLNETGSEANTQRQAQLEGINRTNTLLDRLIEVVGTSTKDVSSANTATPTLKQEMPRQSQILTPVIGLSRRY